VAERVEHEGALEERRRAEHVIEVGRVGDGERAGEVSSSGGFDVRLVRGPTSRMLFPEHGRVRRQPFIEPCIGPAPYREGIAEPLVRQLVRQNPLVAAVARQEARAEAWNRLMFAEALCRELRDAVLLVSERIGA
jgi:hypothetical protein